MTPSQRTHYEHCLAQGTAPRLAEMFALGQPPMSNTDREFLAGFGPSGGQFENKPGLGDAYAAEARRQGVDITGAVYLSGLAAYPGDPRAWVRGRGDIQHVVAERGWACEGTVNVKARERTAEPSGGGLAEDIIQSEVAAILDTVPEPARVDVEDLREQVIDRHAPHYARHAAAEASDGVQ